MPAAAPEPRRGAPADAAAAPDPAQGVFETLRAVDGQVQHTHAHLERLERSVRALYGRRLPPQLEHDVAQHAAGLAPGVHRIRVDAVPAAGGRGVDTRVTATPAPAVPAAPVLLRPLVVPGGLGPHKWRDRRLLDAHTTDAVPLLVDADAIVLEAAWANVWLLEDDRLVTPPADGRLLSGVTRRRLLDIAPHIGLDARAEPVSLRRARAADGILLTSSLRLAVPARLDRGPADARTESTARTIRAALS